MHTDSRSNPTQLGIDSMAQLQQLTLCSLPGYYVQWHRHALHRVHDPAEGTT